jgi:hypothetical protein
MKPHGHKFSARLKYTFSRYGLEVCTQCRKTRDEHIDGKCLFESTVFKQHELMDFFELLMRKGGVLTIKVGRHALSQKIKVPAIDQGANTVSGEIQTEGDAFLGEIDAEKR